MCASVSVYPTSSVSWHRHLQGHVAALASRSLDVFTHFVVTLLLLLLMLLLLPLLLSLLLLLLSVLVILRELASDS